MERLLRIEVVTAKRCHNAGPNGVKVSPGARADRRLRWPLVDALGREFGFSSPPRFAELYVPRQEPEHYRDDRRDHQEVDDGRPGRSTFVLAVRTTPFRQALTPYRPVNLSRLWGCTAQMVSVAL